MNDATCATAATANHAADVLTETLTALMVQGVSAVSLATMTAAATADGPVAAPRGASAQGDGSTVPAAALTGVPADVSDAMMEALSESLGACLSRLLDPDSAPEEKQDLVGRLGGVVRSLAAQGPPPAHDDEAAAAESELLLGVLRDTAWQLMQESVDRLEPSAFGRAAVVELLDCMASIASQQVRGPFVVHSYT